MAVLIRASLISILIVGSARAIASGEDFEPDPRAIAIQEQSKSLCFSSEEFIKTLKVLRTNKDIVLPESTSRRIAEKVAGGCEGAADRFAHILILLKTVGLSDRKALQMGLEFAGHSPEVQKNFSAIFTHAFMDEFFDYEYALAVGLAYELSKDYQGNPELVREDFLELVKFCKADKSLALPNKTCAEFSIKLARLSQYFPEGVREPFLKLYKDLREKKEFSLDIRTALEASYNILKNGPTAPANFFKGYEFATAKAGLALDMREALKFALRMAERSYVGDKPPVILDRLHPGARMANASTP